MKRKWTFMLTFVLSVCLLLTTGIMSTFAADDDGLDDSIPALEVVNELTYDANWASNSINFNINLGEWQGSKINSSLVEYRNPQGDPVSVTYETNGITLFVDFQFHSKPNVSLPNVDDVIIFKQGAVFTGTDPDTGESCSRQIKEEIIYKCTKADDSGVTWEKVVQAEELQVGNLGRAVYGEFEIPLTDGSQKVIGGQFGDIDPATSTSGIIDYDWHYSYVNDESLIKLVYNGEEYTVKRMTVFNGQSPAGLWIEFEDRNNTKTIYDDVGKGAILSLDSELVITDAKGNVYNFGENGLTYYHNGVAWSKVTLTDSAADITISNASAFASDFCVGNMETAEITFASGKAAILTDVKTDNEDVVTVNAKGEITAVSEGNATVTFTFGTIEKELSVTVAAALQPDTMRVSLKANSVFADADGALIAYVGEEIDKDKLANILEAQLGYTSSGRFDAPFDITADMISFDGYDNTKKGTSTIKVIKDSITGTLNVNVYEISLFSAPSAASVSFYATKPHIEFSSDTNQDYPNNDMSQRAITDFELADYISLKSAEKNGASEYELNDVDYMFLARIVVGFKNKSQDNLEVGDVLTLKKGLRVYMVNDGIYRALYELRETKQYVWAGERWADFVAEAQEIGLDVEEVSLAVGASYTIPYTVMPAGSYIKPIITSSDESIIKVNADGTISALKETEENAPVTVTIKLGDDNTTAKTLSVTAAVAQVVGFEAYTTREINVAQGSDFSFEYFYGASTEARNIQAVAVFDNGSRGIPFDLSEENTDVKEFDNTKIGTQTVTLTVTEGDKTFDMTVNVNVRSVAELVSNFVGDDIFNQNAVVLYIGFGQSVVNEVNVPEAISGTELSDFIVMKRGDEEIPVTAKVNGIYVVINPVFPNDWAAADKKFKDGDLIVLKEGMPFIRWTGDAQNYNMIGAGEYIVAGKIAYEAVYEYGGPKNWATYIDYIDFTVANETIELGFGKMGDVGATMVPAYATIGDFTVESEDPSIVSVNANGLIKGEKIGTTRVKITLYHERLEPIVKTVTVNVVDVKSSIKFNETKIYVPTDTVTLTGEMLKDMGITGIFVWASGKEEGEVDMSKVRIQGFSANAEGEQEITVRITENGVTVTGKLTVVVGEKPEEGCGCSCDSSISNITTIGLIISVMLIAAATILVAHKAKKANK